MRARALLVLALPLAPSTFGQTFTRTLDQAALVFDVGEHPSGAALGLWSDAKRSWLGLVGAMGPQRVWGANQIYVGLDVAADGRVALFGQRGDLEPCVATLDPVTGAGWTVRLDDYLSSALEFAGFADGTWCASGGLVALGNAYDFSSTKASFLVRFADDGTVLWARSFPGWGNGSVVELADGSFVAAVSNSGLVDVVRVSPLGDHVWTHRVTSGGELRPRLTVLTDGTLVCGMSEGVLVHLTADGVVLEGRRLTQSGADLALFDVAATADGGFAAVGTSGAMWPFASDALLWKLDANGDLERQVQVGDPNAQFLFSLAVCANGDVLVGGRSNLDAWMARVDASFAPAGCTALPAWSSLADVDATWVDVAETLSSLPGQRTPIAGFSAETLPSSDGACIGGLVGVRACDPAVPNSSGASAVLWAGGSDAVATNELKLCANSLPSGRPGYFLAGQGFGTVVPPGSQGVFCLAGGTAYRFTQPLTTSGSSGALGRRVDLTAIPGYGAVAAGETWYFQAWFRDANPGPTSNFSDVVGITFQ